jgi:regulator of replication initiation timing
MKTKTVAAALTAIIVILSVTSIALYSQFSGLQTRVSQLETQNAELQNQNSTLQEQLKDLQQQFKEQQDRASDLTYQLALERHLRVEITQAHCSKGWYAYGGVTVSHPANVTVVNNDVVSLFGLTATFQLVDKNSGTQIGHEGVMEIERLDVGKSQVVNGSVLVELNVNVDNAVCKITISKGSIILDEWTGDLT